MSSYSFDGFSAVEVEGASEFRFSLSLGDGSARTTFYGLNKQRLLNLRRAISAALREDKEARDAAIDSE